MRAVLDPNVLVSVAISTAGPPRQIISAWVNDSFELITSPALLDELADVLGRSKFRRWISNELASEFIAGLSQDATNVDDPPALEGASVDPDDDYLIALARAASADYLVSGDHHRLDLPNPDPPVLTPRQFAELLQP